MHKLASTNAHKPKRANDPVTEIMLLTTLYPSVQNQNKQIKLTRSAFTPVNCHLNFKSQLTAQLYIGLLKLQKYLKISEVKNEPRQYPS